MKSTTVKQIVAVAAVGVFAACAGPAITDAPRRGSDGAQLFGGGQPQLISCPTNQTASTSGVVSPLGGVLSVGGTTVSIPAGALLASANVTLTIPASEYMEIDVSVEGVEHFIFELPVVVTLSYARCGSQGLAPLLVWHIDGDHALLENMGGIDNKILRTVTFTTGHLSGYAVANFE